MKFTIPEREDLKKVVGGNVWEIGREFREDMLVPARFYASEEMIEDILGDRSLGQLVNVATLPGIVGFALGMPDMHEGYGFPVGAVAATSFPGGAISPGGIGYDINCGMRFLKSGIGFSDLERMGEVKAVGGAGGTESPLEALANQIFRDIPTGTGKGGIPGLTERDLDGILAGGAEYMVKKGFGREDDLAVVDEGGKSAGAAPEFVSERARMRGMKQVGSLGSGNHFLEIQRVEKIFDKELGEAFGLFEDQIGIMIHTGSRGLGHQIATDYIRLVAERMEKYGIKPPDRELGSVPFDSEEGRQYFAAQNAGQNFAYANRQVITHVVREAWARIFAGKVRGEDLDLEVLWEGAHNVAEVEEHAVPSSGSAGKGKGARPEVKKLIVHRKGATKAFPAGAPGLPEVYKETGNPVLVPGTMGTASYVLVGTEKAYREVYGTLPHGAGRRMSRSAAKREVQGHELRRQLEEKGISIRSHSNVGLAEEAPIAYKDVDNVVEAVVEAGLAKKVARLRPKGVIKG